MMKWYYFLALIPFIGMLGGLGFANRVTPYIVGMPFLMFWIIAWTVIGSGVMWVIFRLDPINKEGHSE